MNTETLKPSATINTPVPDYLFAYCTEQATKRLITRAAYLRGLLLRDFKKHEKKILPKLA